MTNQEFSDLFDVLYNSITSNQAPGLDEYEKSVFLTKALNEIVKSYFNPRSNKTQEGFDGSIKRQIDFSKIIRTVTYNNIIFEASSKITDIGNSETLSTNSLSLPSSKIVLALKPSSEGMPKIIINKDPFISNKFLVSYSGLQKLQNNIDKDLYDVIPIYGIGSDITDLTPTLTFLRVTLFGASIFDFREESKSVDLASDIMMFINEYVEVIRNDKPIKLTVSPISHIDYSRMLNKPFKRPLKNQAWRLLDSSGNHSTAELIVGNKDQITLYVIRYVKRPKAIILKDLDGVSLGNGNIKEQSCELDESLHEEILQRAVELAKAAYMGSLNELLTLGNTSQTDIGFIPQLN